MQEFYLARGNKKELFTASIVELSSDEKDKLAAQLFASDAANTNEAKDNILSQSVILVFIKDKTGNKQSLDTVCVVDNMAEYEANKDKIIACKDFNKIGLIRVTATLLRTKKEASPSTPQRLSSSPSAPILNNNVSANDTNHSAKQTEKPETTPMGDDEDLSFKKKKSSSNFFASFFCCFNNGSSLNVAEQSLLANDSLGTELSASRNKFNASNN
jgi:hypothetical protein